MAFNESTYKGQKPRWDETIQVFQIDPVELTSERRKRRLIPLDHVLLRVFFLDIELKAEDGSTFKVLVEHGKEEVLEGGEP